MMDHLSTAIVIVAIVAILSVAVGGGWFVRRRPSKLNREEFQTKWQTAQGLCSKEDTWPLAVINADKLLDEALKKLKYRGKTMGERMVAAQHEIQDNDSMWFGHKLRNKLVHEDMKKLKKKDVMTALIGLREALKDLGAL
ncbi:MAG: hypothetical protein ACREGB_02115 [Candidatus Saccharimonadales bacterium]